MSFSLRRFLGGITPVISAIPGVGTAIGTAITLGQAISPGREYRAAQRAALMPGEPIYQVANGGGVTPTVGTTGGLRVAASGVAAILAKIAIRFGRRIAKWRVIDLIRKWGPTAAGAALGITADEAIELWLSAGPRRRRARGISAADIRRTGRVLGQLDRFNDRVRKFCRQVATGRRRAPAPRRARR